MAEKDISAPTISSYDLIIIGGGPAGLSAAIYAARARLSTLVLDKNPAAGALGSADRIENYPGIPGAVSGTELLSRLREQALSFGATIRQEQVYGIDLGAESRRVIAGNASYDARALIIATGAMGRGATIKGEEELTGRGVSYCATCDAAFYKDREVAVAGNAGEVIEEIEALSKFARSITFITREKEIAPEQTAILKHIHGLIVKTGSRIEEITGDGMVETITVSDADGAKEILGVSGVFLYLHGNRPITDFLYGAIETTPEGCLQVDRETMVTSIEGVFAVGDVICKRIRQVVSATAEGCIAALAAEQFVNRRAKMSSQWSHGGK